MPHFLNWCAIIMMHISFWECFDPPLVEQFWNDETNTQIANTINIISMEFCPKMVENRKFKIGSSTVSSPVQIISVGSLVPKAQRLPPLVSRISLVSTNLFEIRRCRYFGFYKTIAVCCIINSAVRLKPHWRAIHQCHERFSFRYDVGSRGQGFSLLCLFHRNRGYCFRVNCVV